MKKINACFDPKDRVVCVPVNGYNQFYYQPVGPGKRTLLFQSSKAMASVFDYFNDRGRRMNGQEPSLTIKQLYDYRQYRNVQLTEVMDRIPIMLEYTLREVLEQYETKKAFKTQNGTSHNRYYDDEYAA